MSMDAVDYGKPGKKLQSTLRMAWTFRLISRETFWASETGTPAAFVVFYDKNLNASKGCPTVILPPAEPLSIPNRRARIACGPQSEGKVFSG